MICHSLRSKRERENGCASMLRFARRRRAFRLMLCVAVLILLPLDQTAVASPVSPVAADTAPKANTDISTSTSTSTDTEAGLPTASRQAAREQFQAALTALEQNDPVAFSLHAEALKNDPLAPYLNFFSLRRKMRTATRADIDAFSVRYPDDFLNSHVRALWTAELVRRKAWAEYLAYAPKPSTVPFLCARAEALYHTKQYTKADALALRLWTVGHSQPAECDPAFKQLDARDKITPQRVRKRIMMAVNQDEIRLARFLARRLVSKSDQEFVEDYIQAHQQPDRLLERLMKHKLREHDAQLIEHALVRIGLDDPEQAMAFVNEVEQKSKLNRATLLDVKNRTVLRALLRWHPEATAWGRSIPVAERSASVREWTVRYYLRHQDWAGVKRAVRVMPANEQSSDEWQYWMARARQAQGDLKAARKLLEPLSERRSYYGFLAAAALGREPQMGEQTEAPPKITPARFERVIDLREVGQAHWARLEWRALQSNLVGADKRAALWLAHQSGWHDLVFVFASSGEQDNNLELRFPLAFRDEMERAIGERPLNLAWVMALARRESAFHPQARSPAGASGLMQIMPATGRQLARQMNLTTYQASDLMVPETNIAMGTTFLTQLLERFGGNRVLATAAYNAGPSNVQRWLPEADGGSLPTDVWVDTLTYRETREYVRAVFSFALVYHWRLYQQPAPLFRPEEWVISPLGQAGK